MDDDPPDDPDDERPEHDRELYAAVLFRIKQNLEKLALERGASSPPRRLTRVPKKIKLAHYLAAQDGRGSASLNVAEGFTPGHRERVDPICWH
jgi:hypothetical protein